MNKYTCGAILFNRHNSIDLKENREEETYTQLVMLLNTPNGMALNERNKIYFE